MADTETAELITEMSEEEFNHWRLQPAGRVFFAYLTDQLGNWRDVAADMVRDGVFRVDAPAAMRNPLYVGGMMRSFDDLLRIRLPDIQGFYREASGGEEAHGGPGPAPD